MGRLVGESLLIVFSVVLALFLNECRASVKDRGLRQVALANVRAEMENNLAVLREWHPYHREVLDNFRDALAADTTHDDLLTENGVILWPLIPRGIVQSLLSSTAWDTLEASPIVTDIDFEALMSISEVYTLQAAGVETTVRTLTRELASRETMDPDMLNQTLVVFSRHMQELTAQEEFLIQRLEHALAVGSWPNDS